MDAFRTRRIGHLLRLDHAAAKRPLAIDVHPAAIAASTSSRWSGTPVATVPDLNAEAGWVRDGHVPAVQGLAGLEFAVVATNSQETADASAKAFGVPAAYASGLEMIRAGV